MPKTIYVYRQFIGSWRGISKEEAEEKIKSNCVIGVEFEATRGDGDTVRIVLLKDYFALFGATEETQRQLVDEYFHYVEEITGIEPPTNFE